MLLYRVKYNESESDIQNTNLLFNIHQTCQNTFEILFFFKKIKTFVFYCIYKFHSSYFVIFENGESFGFLVLLVILYILYYTCRSLTRVGLIILTCFLLFATLTKVPQSDPTVFAFATGLVSRSDCRSHDVALTATVAEAKTTHHEFVKIARV